MKFIKEPPNKINMIDRGCSPVELKKLYEEGMTISELKKKFSVRDSKVMTRWFKEAGIVMRSSGHKYSFNQNYFDNIDSEEKAYWIGFIWCDGYVCKRIRKNSISYEFKLDLMDEDMKMGTLNVELYLIAETNK